VFESLLVLALPSVPADQLLGSLLAWRAVYYLLPLLVAAVLFGGQELRAQRSALARIEQLAAAYIAPIVPQVSGALVFVAGFSAAGHRGDAVDRSAPVGAARRAAAGGAGGLAPGRQRDRPGAADPGAGAVPAPGRGLSAHRLAAGRRHGRLAAARTGIEQALLLGLVLLVLWLGRRAFYRPARSWRSASRRRGS
jgi:hypothetical protein